MVVRVTFDRYEAQDYIREFEESLVDIVSNRLETLGFKRDEDFIIFGTYGVAKHFKELEIEVHRLCP